MTAYTLLKHIFNTEELNRPDIIVRILFIEWYYGKNDFGDKLYYKMQGLRVKKIDVSHYHLKFIKLIQSFEQNGYHPNTQIILGHDNSLADGSHRLACCIYFNQLDKELLTKFEDKKVSYNFDWFEYNFTEQEFEIIKEKYNEVKQNDKLYIYTKRYE